MHRHCAEWRIERLIGSAAKPSSLKAAASGGSALISAFFAPPVTVYAFAGIGDPAGQLSFHENFGAQCTVIPASNSFDVFDRPFTTAIFRKAVVFQIKSADTLKHDPSPPEYESMSERQQNNSYPLPFDMALLNTLRGAGKVDVFVFPDAGELGSERSVALVRHELRMKLADPAISRLKAAVFTAGTYQVDSGIRKSCPFDPNLGFRISDEEEEEEEVWWLVSFSCQTAVLVRGSDDWRGTGTVNLSQDGLMVFKLLSDLN